MKIIDRKALVAALIMACGNVGVYAADSCSEEEYDGLGGSGIPLAATTVESEGRAGSDDTMPTLPEDLRKALSFIAPDQTPEESLTQTHIDALATFLTGSQKVGKKIAVMDGKIIIDNLISALKSCFPDDNGPLSKLKMKTMPFKKMRPAQQVQFKNEMGKLFFDFLNALETSTFKYRESSVKKAEPCFESKRSTKEYNNQRSQIQFSEKWQEVFTIQSLIDEYLRLMNLSIPTTGANAHRLYAEERASGIYFFTGKEEDREPLNHEMQFIFVKDTYNRYVPINFFAEKPFYSQDNFGLFDDSYQRRVVVNEDGLLEMNKGLLFYIGPKEEAVVEVYFG